MLILGAWNGSEHIDGGSMRYVSPQTELHGVEGNPWFS